MTTVRKMLRNVVALHPEDALDTAWRVMREQGLEALPVVDARLHVVGALSEDDLLVRCIQRTTLPWWALMVREPDELANGYRRAVGTTVADVMTARPMSIAADATTETAAALMREHRVRILPVVVDEALAGIVTAADLIDSLALSPAPPRAPITDAELVEAMECRLDAEPWVARYLVRVVARHGVIELDGLIDSAAQHAAVVTMARTIPGCMGVEDHLVTQSEVLRKVPRLTRRI